MRVTSLLIAMTISLFLSGCKKAEPAAPQAVCDAWMNSMHEVVKAGTSGEVKAMVMKDCIEWATTRQAQRAEQYGCWSACMAGDKTVDDCDQSCKITGLPGLDQEVVD
jgi:hypothetical protein